MTNHPEEQYMYTNKLLEIKIDVAKKVMLEYSMQNSSA